MNKEKIIRELLQDNNIEFDFHKGAENNEINIIAGPRRVTLNGMYWDYKSVNKITLNGENYE